MKPIMERREERIFKSRSEKFREWPRRGNRMLRRKARSAARTLGWVMLQEHPDGRTRDGLINTHCCPKWHGKSHLICQCMSSIDWRGQPPKEEPSTGDFHWNLESVSRGRPSITDIHVGEFNPVLVIVGSALALTRCSRPLTSLGSIDRPARHKIWSTLLPNVRTCLLTIEKGRH